MNVEHDFTLVTPFQLLMPPEQKIPFVFNSPHSGSYYPPSFLEASSLDALAIRRSEDCYVDELFAAVLMLGAPLLRAHFPRAYLDVNRGAYELDQRMFSEPLPAYANTQSARVAGGLGTIPRLVGEGQLIYPGKILLETAFDRIENLYKPYHAALDDLIKKTQNKFGYAVLIDCHSMPGGIRRGLGTARADFIIGDRFGRSCSMGLAGIMIDLLQAQGYDVAYNKPYAGGFITEHYGQPGRGVHALQLEINRSLYVDEATLEKRAGFETLRGALYELLCHLTTLPEAVFNLPPLAAE